MRYSTIENWSKNMYNLNTKRARVEKGGTIEWVSGSFGSHTGCLYPMSVLQGEGARMEFTGITFAGAGQDLDTGARSCTPRRTRRAIFPPRALPATAACRTSARPSLCCRTPRAASPA